MELQKKINTVESKLADSSLYQNEQKLAEVNRKYNELKQNLQKEQSEWDLHAEELMALEG